QVRHRAPVAFFERDMDVRVWKNPVSEWRERVMNLNRILDEPRPDQNNGRQYDESQPPLHVSGASDRLPQYKAGGKQRRDKRRVLDGPGETGGNASQHQKIVALRIARPKLKGVKHHKTGPRQSNIVVGDRPVEADNGREIKQHHGGNSHFRDLKSQSE